MLIDAKWKKCGLGNTGNGGADIIFDQVTFFVCGSNEASLLSSTISENFLSVGYFSKSLSDTSTPKFSRTKHCIEIFPSESSPKSISICASGRTGMEICDFRTPLIRA